MNATSETISMTYREAIGWALAESRQAEIYQRRSRVLLDALSALMADHLYVKNLNQSNRDALDVISAIQAGDL